MDRIGLEGRWALCLQEKGNEEMPAYGGDWMDLPGTTSAQHKTPLREEAAEGHLTDPYAFEGSAWVQRTVEVPEAWAGRDVFLTLERTRRTTLYLDGKKIGARDSLCKPHVYELGALQGRHTLEICVQNTGYPTAGGHMTSPDTQTNWLGITGRIELTARPKARLEDIRVFAQDEHRLTVTCTSTGEGEAELCVDGGEVFIFRAEKGPVTFSFTVREAMERWDEFTQALHTLCVSMNGEEQTVRFGLCTFQCHGRRLLVNGRETFLRGKHDALLFPMTGYAPTDRETWRRVLSTAKAWGINHYRFHTCCPPEAAFDAADELGIYMEPELPFWGTVPEEEGEETAYLLEEGMRILDAFGNHPSFFMLSLGNELWGSKAQLSSMLARLRAHDPRRLYVDGSNNFQFVPCVLPESDVLVGVRLGRERLYRGSYAMCDSPQGFVQTEAPSSMHTYDPVITSSGDAGDMCGGSIQVQVGTEAKEVEAEAGDVLVPEIPVISHEIGQYEMYPDFREIECYTGVLKPENLKRWREKAAARGLLPYADRFFRASGQLAADCYRLELEAALLSRELSGFQMLDLQDYTGQGTALVGMLNAFMEEKSLIPRETFRQFCAPTVVVAKLPRFVFQDDEEVECRIAVASTDPAVSFRTVDYRLTDAGETLIEGTAEVSGDGRVMESGMLHLKPYRAPIDAPRKVRLHLQLRGTEYMHDTDLMIFPRLDLSISKDEISGGGYTLPIVHDVCQAERLSEKGKTCLCIPDFEGRVPGSYCTDFWCYPMFRSISESMGKPVPVGTLGCLIETEHPALRDFPSLTYTTPQWYALICHSHCEEINFSEDSPIVQVIDHPDRATPLALLYEKKTAAGKVLVCTARLWEIGDRTEVRWFAWSLMRYLLEGGTEC